MRVLVITSCTGEKSVKTEHQLTPDDFAQGSDHVAQREQGLQTHMTPAEDLSTGQQHKRLMSGVRQFRENAARDNDRLDLWIPSPPSRMRPTPATSRIARTNPVPTSPIGTPLPTESLSPAPP